ncbi:MAG: protoporphyrinogen oxidase [Bacteroidota bacterium]
MNQKKIDILVVGEGITGLSTAYWLKKRGLAVLVLSKDSDVGGTMKSIEDRGFLYETGANTALETTPLFKDLVAGLHLEDEFIYANPEGKNRFILRNDMLLPLPLGPLSLLRTDLFSTKGKLRLLKEPLIGRAHNEESIAEFVSRRLGHEFLDYAIDPFVAGVFAGKAEQLSVRSAFPKLYALEKNYGGLIKGMIWGVGERRQREEKAKDRAETFSFRSGMQTLPRALAESMRSEIIAGARVTGIQQPKRTRVQSRRYIIEYLFKGKHHKIETDYVVFATAAYDAAPIIRRLSPETAEVLDSIYYSPIVSIFLGYKREDIYHPLNGFGFLVPSKEKKNILGCLWNSSLFPSRAPKDHAAVNAFMGGARQPELYEMSDAGILKETTKALSSAMQISGKPVYWNLTRWRKSIPQYTIGYQRKIDALERFEQHFAGIVLTGNYRGGISVGDCVKNSYELAQSLAAKIILTSKSSERNVL